MRSVEAPSATAARPAVGGCGPFATRASRRSRNDDGDRGGVGSDLGASLEARQPGRARGLAQSRRIAGRGPEWIGGASVNPQSDRTNSGNWYRCEGQARAPLETALRTWVCAVPYHVFGSLPLRHYPLRRPCLLDYMHGRLVDPSLDPSLPGYVPCRISDPACRRRTDDVLVECRRVMLCWSDHLDSTVRATRNLGGQPAHAADRARCVRCAPLRPLLPPGLLSRVTTLNRAPTPPTTPPPEWPGPPDGRRILEATTENFPISAIISENVIVIHAYHAPRPSRSRLQGLQPSKERRGRRCGGQGRDAAVDRQPLRAVARWFVAARHQLPQDIRRGGACRPQDAAQSPPRTLPR